MDILEWRMTVIEQLQPHQQSLQIQDNSDTDGLAALHTKDTKNIKLHQSVLYMLLHSKENSDKYM